MSIPVFQNYACWNQERISEVINTEAIAIDKATFLATHAPIESISYIQTPYLIADTQERGLLQELLHCATENQHAFVVVQGIPGTGKSHLIRWLKESYETANRERQGNDLVLLIERAQCNLRGTLQQIIQSEVFEGEILERHLNKLKNATSELSKEALAETILDQLRLAATGGVSLLEEQKPQQLISKNIKAFLLDLKVRGQLTSAGGPIDRIARFLSVGTGASAGKDEAVEFKADDFLFGADMAYLMKGEAYPEVRALVEGLSSLTGQSLREELAQYLNCFLNYAITHTTALSSDDLKQMFNELRVYLHQQNRQLALFIEDITAFTGIDAGLVDVLATQHTGEKNTQFCRLVSVIGVTDAYFSDKFPKNMKERVTHLLTLDTRQDGTVESDLLTTPDAVAAMAARYLNAMRLEYESFYQWCNLGAQPERLPNACSSCSLRMQCHAAFGYVDLGAEGNESQQVGLYPFNKRALWTMYKNIDKNSRTPRSLLNSVLRYVLESYGGMVRLGQFPPSRERLGSDFKTPSLKKLQQRILIGIQGRDHAKRIELLVVFWGDGTIDVTGDGGHHLIGGLPEEVFNAFDIHFIEGDILSTPDFSSSVSQPNAAAKESPSYPTMILPNFSDALSTGSLTEVSGTTSPSMRTESVDTRQNKYKESITHWLRGGKLSQYEPLREYLATLIKFFIDWEAHGISNIQVEERLKPGKLAIADQIGQIPSGNLVFERSEMLGQLLYALGDFSENQHQIDQTTLGGHLTVFSSWLYEHELMIVDFVRQCEHKSTSALTLEQVSLLNCVLLACLQGKLKYDSYSVEELFHLVMRDCAEADNMETNWQKCVEEAQKTHSSAWIDLMRNIEKKKNNVRTCRQTLLQLLIRGRGERKGKYFIDAAVALDNLKLFEQNNWELPVLGKVSENVPETWKVASEVYKTLQKYFTQALEEDRKIVQEYHTGLIELMGSYTSQEVFSSIGRWIDSMRKWQLPYKFEQRFTVEDAPKLDKVIATLDAALAEQRTMQLALRLSGFASIKQDAQSHLQNLKDFYNEVSEQIGQLNQDISRLQVERAETLPQSPVQVEEEYCQVEHLLTLIREFK
jgi:hypothetical protein